MHWYQYAEGAARLWRQLVSGLPRMQDDLIGRRNQNLA